MQLNIRTPWSLTHSQQKPDFSRFQQAAQLHTIKILSINIVAYVTYAPIDRLRQSCTTLSPHLGYQPQDLLLRALRVNTGGALSCRHARKVALISGDNAFISRGPALSLLSRRFPRLATLYKSKRTPVLKALGYPSHDIAFHCARCVTVVLNA